MARYTFAPSSRTKTITTYSLSGVSFLPTLLSGHSIAGNAGVASVTIGWVGPGGATGGVTTDSFGNYIIPYLPDGTYTITPRLSHFSFAPTSASVTMAGANIININFTATNLFALPLARDSSVPAASGQIIPLNVTPNQSFSVNLEVDGGAITLQFALRFNMMAGYWVLSISDAGGNLILDSLPLITGWYPAGNLLGQYGYLKIGSAYILNEGTGTSDYPGTTDLGTGFQFLWGDTPAEVA